MQSKYFLSTAKQVDNGIGSVRLSVCGSVWVSDLSCLNRLTLIFGMKVDLDPG